MKIYALLAACLLASNAMAGTASLSWTVPTTNTDGSPITGTITYNIYQAVQGATLAKVQSAVTGSTVTVTAGLAAGSTQCFAVTAVVNAVESAQSNTACAAIPFPSPNAPTQITVVIH